jgi:hypothetical protein
MTKLPAPRGRPPFGCLWVGDKYVNLETGEEFSSARNKHRARLRRRAYERARYWDIATKVRLKRLERGARESGRQARPMQLKLDQIIAAVSEAGAALEEATPDKGSARVQIPGKCICATINHSTDS